MDVFIGEYVCGGGFVRTPLDTVPLSLRQEGRAMLSAVAEDFAEVADRVHVAADPRVRLSLPPNVIIHPVTDESSLWGHWLAAAQGCDSAILIAPETDGVLAQSVAMLQSTGINILNGFGDFLRCASDKWETARMFAVAGVPHPATWTFGTVPKESLPEARRWVVKPRDGCGTDNVCIFESLESALQATENTGHLIQPWIEGRAASIAVIVDGMDVAVLPAVRQSVTADDLTYRGGQGPLDSSDQRRAAHLAGLAVRALPRKVRGYVGFDVVLADDPDQDCVIEVNPRITTSYVGLRRIVDGNLAARLLGLDHSPVSCAAECDEISWNAEGEVWSNQSSCDTFR